MGAEEMRAKALPEIDILKEQAAAQKSMESGTIYKNAGKNNKTDEIAPSEKTVKVQENEEVSGEDMGDKHHPELKENESNAVTEAVETAPASAEFMVMEKSLDKEIVKKDDSEDPQQAATSEKDVLNGHEKIYSDHVQENLSEKKAEAPKQTATSEKAVLNENKVSSPEHVQESLAEKKVDVQDKIIPPGVFSQLFEVPRKSDIRVGQAETIARHDKSPEKEEKMVLEKKDLVETDNGAKPAKPSLGLPLNESLFLKDIKIEVLLRNDEDAEMLIYLLKNPYLSLRKRHAWGKEKKVGLSEESGILADAQKEKKKIFSVAKAGEGIYAFVMENRGAAMYNAGVVFVLYGGQKHERRKEIKSVIVPPFSKARFMFVLPEVVFWDDEDFFTGSIEDSDSITKFNGDTGFAWREEKEY